MQMRDVDSVVDMVEMINYYRIAFGSGCGSVEIEVLAPPGAPDVDVPGRNPELNTIVVHTHTKNKFMSTTTTTLI